MLWRRPGLQEGSPNRLDCKPWAVRNSDICLPKTVSCRQNGLSSVTDAADHRQPLPGICLIFSFTPATAPVTPRARSSSYLSMSLVSPARGAHRVGIFSSDLSQQPDPHIQASSPHHLLVIHISTSKPPRGTNAQQQAQPRTQHLSQRTPTSCSTQAGGPCSSILGSSVLSANSSAVSPPASTYP